MCSDGGVVCVEMVQHFVICMRTKDDCCLLLHLHIYNHIVCVYDCVVYVYNRVVHVQLCVVHIKLCCVCIQSCCVRI